ncbi:hypothetical protein V5O48_018186, partial [Marasmius crinis-equi]
MAQFSAFPVQQQGPFASTMHPIFAQPAPMQPSMHQPSPTPTLQSVSSSNSYALTPPPTMSPPDHQMPHSSHPYDSPAPPSMNAAPANFPPLPSPSSSTTAFTNVAPASFVTVQPVVNSASPDFRNHPPSENPRSSQNKTSNHSKGSSVPSPEPLASQKQPSEASTSQAGTKGSKLSHYRRNYDDQITHPPFQKSGRNQNSKSSQSAKKDNSTRRANQQARSKQPQDQPQNDPPPKEQKYIRMVTLLITDMRSGEEDHSLVEVNVPLKQADPYNPEDGFWTQAEDVIRELQGSLSWDSQVYTMRAKYRQIFMKTWFDGETQETHHEGTQANLAVSPDRTLTMVVVK